MINLQFFERAHIEQLINWIGSPQFLMQWGGPQFDFPLNVQQLEDYTKGANEEHSNTFVYSVVKQKK